jgi:hypothetical protein
MGLDRRLRVKSRSVTDTLRAMYGGNLDESSKSKRLLCEPIETGAIRLDWDGALHGHGRQYQFRADARKGYFVPLVLRTPR